ncbi:MAG: (2Fe-2S)-binding protein [Calditrichaeota bacterium]|nr:MAG: (2Fe-2S)-binding protein [Calditrichota bacterium]
MKLHFSVNGKDIEIEVSPGRRLLDILRDDLQLTGTKEGCGRGECGSCTVILNGQRVNSCLVPAFQLTGSSVLTIEGLAAWPQFDEIEKAFVEHGAAQCGFCIPGYVMSAVAALKELKCPRDQDELRFRFAGNICRCTGYSKLLEVILDLQNRPELINKVRKLLG